MKKLLAVLMLLTFPALAEEVRVGGNPAEMPVYTTDITDATATTFTSVGVPVTLNNNFTTGTVYYTIHCHDGTTSNSGTLRGHVEFSCSNVLGSEACSFATVSADNSVSEDRGTYGIGTTSFQGANPGSSTIELQVNSDCTGVAGPDTMYIEWSLDLMQQATVSSFEGGAIANPLLLPDGSASAPAWAWSSETNTGFIYTGTAGTFNMIAVGNVNRQTRFGGYFLDILSDTPLFRMGASTDVVLTRDAANTLALRNSTNAQTFNIYNTYTDGSNYERGALEWSANIFRLSTSSNGTGTGRNILIDPGGGTTSNDGHFSPVSDDSSSLGGTGQKWQKLNITRTIQGSKTTALTDETATDIALLSVDDASHLAGTWHFSAHDATSDDATFYQFDFACVNNADTETCTINETQETQVGTDADTIDCTGAIDVDETNAVMFKVTCNQEDDDDAMTGYWRFDLLNSQTVTPQ